MDATQHRLFMPLNRAWALAVGIVGISAALVVYATNAHASAAIKPAPHFSAVQLADGILFGAGPAAPYAAGHTTHLTARQQVLEKLVNSKLKADSSGAKIAAKELQSGDRMQVRQGLVYIGTVYKDVLDQEDGAQNVASAVTALANQKGLTASAPNGISADSAQPDRLLWTYSTNITDVYTVSYAAVDLALEAAALLAVALVLVVVFPFASPSGALAADQLVNKLAVHLATA